ncbi:MAG: multiheme c-type cytochrome [Candidatus Brocadiales bacterium]
MAAMRGEKVGPDDSGDVYHGGGLSAYYTGPDELFPGKGRYGQLFKFLPMVRWYDPDYYYNNPTFHPKSGVTGQYTGHECIVCHTAENPQVVVQWKKSRHARPGEGKEVVGCERCHGTDHEKLLMPSYNTCGECHPQQLRGHRDGGRGSHAHAYHLDLIEDGCYIEKPAEEVSACLTCHAIAENRCDGCHTRHEFSVTEARRPTSCGVCHSGPEQYEYEMYMQSYHGMIYQGEAQGWDFSQPTASKNYKAPTCAYCHMQQGEHNVRRASTAYTFMGTSLVDRGAPRYRDTREWWVKTCQGCHSPRFARDQLEAMDEAVKLSFTKYREAMAIVVDLLKDGLLDPMPQDLAPDWRGQHAFSLLPDGHTRKYNVSEIERLTYELLVDITDAIYKAKAHGAVYSPIYGYWEWAQDRWLIKIKAEASRLRRLSEIEKRLGIKHEAHSSWSHGEYTDMFLGWRRKVENPP